MTNERAIDANGVSLTVGDRVEAMEIDGSMVRGTLNISTHPYSKGRWCVDYDDGESYLVINFNQIWKI